MITQSDQITRIPPRDYGVDHCGQATPPPEQNWRKIKLSLASLLLTSTLFTLLLTCLPQIVSLIRLTQGLQFNSTTSVTLSSFASKSSIAANQHSSSQLIQVKISQAASEQITIHIIPAASDTNKLNSSTASKTVSDNIPTVVMMNSLPEEIHPKVIQLIVEAQ